ncbi:MAG: hypothetical protein R3E73_12265 [Porticoccaceae bacterium]
MNKLASGIWSRINLATRLSLLVTLITLCLAVGTAYNAYLNIKHNAREELEKEHHHLLDTLTVFVQSFAGSRKRPRKPSHRYIGINYCLW